MQLNVRTDPAFTRELDSLVRHTGLKTRTAAIKHAVHVTLQQARAAQTSYDFRKAAGVARKLKPKARFQSDDELYTDGMP